MEIAWLLVAIIAGTLAASLLSCLPALHIYNVAGIVLLIVLQIQEAQGSIPGNILSAFMMSLVVAYSLLNTIPSIVLGAPDESAIFITLPGNRYLMLGRGLEAVLLTGIGGLGGLAFLVMIYPAAPHLLPIVQNILSPHMFWILASILAFMVLSEWPKGGDRGKTAWARFYDGWRNLAAGLVTLSLSGFLGVILLNRPLMPIEVAFQNIMPAFVGLFAVPWVFQNMISQTKVPPQHMTTSLDTTPRLFFRGVGAGCLGGLFAAVFPVVTGGMGGLLAGHATSQRDERLFIISQGASKTVYYVGAYMLVFVPGFARTRGGMSWMLSGFYQPQGYGDYYMILATICISGALSFLLLILFSKWLLRLVEVVDYRLISLATFFIIVAVVYYMTDWQGILVMTVASGIGAIPVAFHSRRMNCMGVLIIPIMLNMSGHGATLANWLGLL